MGKHNDSDMSRLEELHLQRELKELILEYIGTLHEAAHPNHGGFALLTCRHRFDRLAAASTTLGRHHNRQDEYIMIRAIVYTQPGHQKWKVVSESSKVYFGITSALQEFSKDLERQMGDMTAKVNVGQKRLFGETGEDVCDEGERSYYDAKRRR